MLSDLVRVVSLKYLAGIKTKQFWNIPQESYFAIKNTNSFIKYFVNPFVDIAVNFLNNSLDIYLFEVAFLVYYQNLPLLQN